MFDRRPVYERARAQRGVLTRAELRALGVSAGRQRRLIAEGALVELAAGVFALGGAPLDEASLVLAAARATSGFAACQSATRLHGLPVEAPPRPQVLRLGRHAETRFTRFEVHTTSWLPSEDVTEVDGIPCLSLARTMLSVAACVPAIPAEVVRGLVDEAVRRRSASDGWLWWMLERDRRRGRNGVRVLERILVDRAEAPTESWLERELLRVLDRAGLPRPICQRRIEAHGAFVARVDLLYEDAGVIIEVTGAVAHSTPAQRAADAERRNRLGILGYVVLEFTYEQVVRHPELVIAAIADALATRSASHLVLPG